MAAFPAVVAAFPAVVAALPAVVAAVPAVLAGIGGSIPLERSVKQALSVQHQVQTVP